MRIGQSGNALPDFRGLRTMVRVTVDQHGKLDVPPEAMEQYRLCPGEQFWLDANEGDLVLHRRATDVTKVYIEPTSRCNLRCRTCIRNNWADPEAHMKMSTFERIMESASALPELKRIVFTGFGEPLVHPQLLQMIALARERGLAVSVGSNGVLLNQATAEELVRLGVDRLVISVDGVRPETYAGVRGAQLSRVLDNIRSLNEIKRTHSSLIPALGLEFVALRSNVGELGQLGSLATHLQAARVLVSNVLCYTESCGDEMLYGYEPKPPFDASSWPVQVGAWVTWGTVDLPRMHWGAERRCRFVQDRSMVVGWDGVVSPCYALSHNYRYFAVDGKEKQVSRYCLGNVNQQSLAEIWMSEEYARFRSEVRAFRFPSCPDCDLRDTCDLRERNEACWGWTPSCADCLWAQDIVRCP